MDCGGGGDLAGEVGVGAGGVDGDGVRAERGDNRVGGVEVEGADVGGVTDHGEENVGELGQLGRGMGQRGPFRNESKSIGVVRVASVEG